MSWVYPQSPAVLPTPPSDLKRQESPLRPKIDSAAGQLKSPAMRDPHTKVKIFHGIFHRPHPPPLPRHLLVRALTLVTDVNVESKAMVFDCIQLVMLAEM
jgi:hypothetical protein